MARKYNVIGLMSGTSMDGLDIAYCTFWENMDKWRFEISVAETVPYSEFWLSSLNNARELNVLELKELNIHYGKYLADCVNDFVAKNSIEHIDFIASHGHTIHHQPENGITVQIGDGEVLRDETNIPVVYDFRTQDVEMGGQGAPLVPIGDQFLFQNFEACLNLGGFSNISFQYKNNRLAFDISPANIVLNYLARKVGKEYDNNGELSANGKLIPELFEKLNSLDYYQNPLPKSLGIEWVEKCIYPLLLDSYSISDMLFTMTKHITFQISEVFSSYGIKNVLVTGGGVFNSFFMDELVNKTVSNIVVPKPMIVEYKEALIFAFMGVLRMENRVNVLKSVTGASKNHSSGKIVGISKNTTLKK